MLLYWYHYAHTAAASRWRPTTNRSAAHFLHLLHGKPPSASHVRPRMHTSLILYAEHEFNASTFTAASVAGTGADMYSAITGGHRRAARAQTRRRQRGRVRNAEALRRS